MNNEEMKSEKIPNPQFRIDKENGPHVRFKGDIFKLDIDTVHDLSPGVAEMLELEREVQALECRIETLRLELEEAEKRAQRIEADTLMNVLDRVLEGKRHDS